MKIVISLLYLILLFGFLFAAFSLFRLGMRQIRQSWGKSESVPFPLLIILGLCFIVFIGVHGQIIFGIADASRISEIQRIYDRRSWKYAQKIKKGTIWDRTMQKERILAYSVKDELGYTRLYPFGASASHIIGYCDLRRKAAGLEAVLNDYLLGKEGKTLYSWSHVLVNQLWREQAQGQDIVSTIDSKIQEAAYKSLTGNRGAAVVIQPSTGDVLALVSSPGFDPKRVKSNQGWALLLSRKHDAPLFNRALAGKYPPGSIFKVIIAAAALESGWNEKIFCGPKGFHPKMSKRPILDFEALGRKKWKGHGWLTLEKALMKSSNSFFANLGTQIGEYSIRRCANRFGLGDRISWNSRFPLMQIAFVPALSYFPPDEMDPVNLAWSSIGQGELLITPFQAALIAAAIANNGVMMQPKLERNIPPLPSGQAISSGTAKKLQKMLRKVVQKGTGYRANVPGLKVAGKTGTAEVGKEPPHSWFIGFASAEKAEIALAVVIENGGLGGVAAAKAAGAVFKAARDEGYFQKVRK